MNTVIKATEKTTLGLAAVAFAIVAGFSGCGLVAYAAHSAFGASDVATALSGLAGGVAAQGGAGYMLFKKGFMDYILS